MSLTKNCHIYITREYFSCTKPPIERANCLLLNQTRDANDIREDFHPNKLQEIENCVTRNIYYPKEKYKKKMLPAPLAAAD